MLLKFLKLQYSKRGGVKMMYSESILVHHQGATDLFENTIKNT
jgi:hypothetical protein